MSSADAKTVTRRLARAHMKRSLAEAIRPAARRPRPTEAPSLAPLDGAGDPIDALLDEVVVVDEDQELDQVDEELDSGEVQEEEGEGHLSAEAFWREELRMELDDLLDQVLRIDVVARAYASTGKGAETKGEPQGKDDAEANKGAGKGGVDKGGAETKGKGKDDAEPQVDKGPANFKGHGKSWLEKTRYCRRCQTHWYYRKGVCYNCGWQGKRPMPP